MYRFWLVSLVLLVGLVAPASANWGGITLDWNYSFGKAYVFGQSGDQWIPGPGATNAWVTVSSAPFVASGSNKYFMFDINVNPGDVVWIDNIKVTNVATGAQLLNDPGLNTGDTGFFPWEMELNEGMTGGLAVGEGVGGSDCWKIIGGGTIPHANYSKILQYDGWGTGTLNLQQGQMYILSYDVKTGAVPEPSSIIALLSGLGVLVGIRRRK